MANFDHWMRLNIGDYLADTMHLNATQNGIYLLLLMHAFKRQKLPHDMRQLARIARVSLRIWKRESPQVLALFTLEGDCLTHKRINAERQEAERLSSRAGATRARSRKTGDSRAHAGAPVTTATTTNPPHDPPVIDLRTRRKKAAGGGWTDVATDIAAEGDDE